MTPIEELDALYIRIGNNEPFTDEIEKRIKELENIIHPPRQERLEYDTGESKGCGCDHPDHCWDCAAIRGGCPEDV